MNHSFFSFFFIALVFSIILLDCSIVYFELTLENELKILVIQQEELSKISRFKFSLDLAVQRAIKDTKSILKFRLPDYSPVIQLIVSEKDARAIYRAIPEKGKICLFLIN